MKKFSNYLTLFILSSITINQINASTATNSLESHQSNIPLPSKNVAAQNNNSNNIDFSDGIAAIVNGKVITIEEIRQEIAPLIRQIKSETKTISDFKKKAELLFNEHLQTKIDNILVVTAFHKEGYKIPKSTIEDQFDEHLKQDFSGNREQFLKYIQAQGKTVRQYRKEIEDFMIVSSMRDNKRRSQVEVSPEKIKEYYNSNKTQFFREESIHIRQITVIGKLNDKGEANFENLKNIQDELKKGTSFADVAKKYSQDDKQKQGGDWGWVSKTDLVSEISSVAFSLKLKEASHPIILKQYAFILYLEEKKEAGFLPLDEVRSSIEKTLSAQISKSSYQQWVEQLRKNAFIKYFDHFLF